MFMVCMRHEIGLCEFNRIHRLALLSMSGIYDTSVGFAIDVRHVGYIGWLRYRCQTDDVKYDRYEMKNHELYFEYAML